VDSYGNLSKMQAGLDRIQLDHKQDLYEHNRLVIDDTLDGPCVVNRSGTPWSPRRSYRAVLTTTGRLPLAGQGVRVRVTRKWKFPPRNHSVGHCMHYPAVSGKHETDRAARVSSYSYFAHRSFRLSFDAIDGRPAMQPASATHPTPIG
jgi:hypothetical protein